jgi:hypothetical protein
MHDHPCGLLRARARAAPPTDAYTRAAPYMPDMAGASVACKLRLARHWLDLEPCADEDSASSRVNDRSVFAWSAAAAVRGDPEAQILLGRCFASGRGITKNFEQARKWFRRAADAGSSEARYRLRLLRVEHCGWLRARHSVIAWVGAGLLVLHATTHGVHVDPLGVLAYLGLSILGFVLVVAKTALGRRAAAPATPQRTPDHVPDYVFDRQVRAWRQRPWRVLAVATEDGAFLAPLLWLGVTPWGAALAGALFGLAHYPAFSARACLRKGFEQTMLALLLLPWAGLWSIVVGHVVWDVALLALGARSRRRRTRATNTAARTGGLERWEDVPLGVA